MILEDTNTNLQTSCKFQQKSALQVWIPNIKDYRMLCIMVDSLAAAHIYSAHKFLKQRFISRTKPIVFLSISSVQFGKKCSSIQTSAKHISLIEWDKEAVRHSQVKNYDSSGDYDNRLVLQTSRMWRSLLICDDQLRHTMHIMLFIFVDSILPEVHRTHLEWENQQNCALLQYGWWKCPIVEQLHFMGLLHNGYCCYEKHLV